MSYFLFLAIIFQVSIVIVSILVIAVILPTCQTRTFQTMHTVEIHFSEKQDAGARVTLYSD